MSKYKEIRRDALGNNFFLDAGVASYAKLQDGHRTSFYKAYIDNYVKQGLIDFDSWTLYQYLLALVVHKQENRQKWNLTLEGIASITKLGKTTISNRLKKMQNAGLLTLETVHEKRENGKGVYVLKNWYFHKPKVIEVTGEQMLEEIAPYLQQGQELALVDRQKGQELALVEQRKTLVVYTLQECETLVANYNQGFSTPKIAQLLRATITEYQEKTKHNPGEKELREFSRIVANENRKDIQAVLDSAILKAKAI